MNNNKLDLSGVDEQPKTVESDASFGLPIFDEKYSKTPSNFEGVNFLDAWNEIHANSKSPMQFFRWSAISMVAMMLERNVYLPFAGNALYPNMYILLVGESASKKTTALVEGKNKMEAAGYPNFTPNRLTMKTWARIFTLNFKLRKLEYGLNNTNILKHDALSEILSTTGAPKQTVKDASLSRANMLSTRMLLEKELDALTGMDDMRRINAVGAIASEFSEFVPSNSAPLLYSLTDLYDTHVYNYYEFDVNSVVYQPCVNLIGGITPASLALKFEVKALEAGFLTRVILVHSEPKDEVIDPLTQGFNLSDDNYSLSMLRQIRNMRGIFSVSDNAKKLAAHIDKHQPVIEDIRLKQFNGRRYAHLMKIAMVRAAGDLRMEIKHGDVYWANSVLTFTELNMPDALGDFGTTPELAVKSAVIKVLHSSSAEQLGMSELQSQVSLLRPKENQTLIMRAIADMLRGGTLMRKEFDDSESIVWLRHKKTNHLAHLDGDLFDSSLIPEWNLNNLGGTNK